MYLLFGRWGTELFFGGCISCFFGKGGGGVSNFWKVGYRTFFWRVISCFLGRVKFLVHGGSIQIYFRCEVVFT